MTGATTAVSYLVRPDRARTFDLVHGSVFLADAVAPVSIDLASGRPTIRLVQATRQVGARTTTDLGVVPVDDGTVLVNRRTGEFNMVASTGFVVKTNGGVPIPQRPGATGATAIASGSRAFVEQTRPTGTSVYLVGQDTVRSAAATLGTVRPRALATVTEPTSTAPGAAATARGDLWLLVGSGGSRTVRRLHVPAGSATGVRLSGSDHGTVPALAAIESTPSGSVAVASAGAIRFVQDGSDRVTRYPRVDGADTVLAATQARARLAFLIHGTDGWRVVSVDQDGRDLRGPTPLANAPADADFAPPAMSAGDLYTVDRSTGWTYRIDPDGTTAVAAYPLAREDGKVIEPGGFGDAYVVARGERVIVNSPTHLEALVLFTDGSRAPLAVEKSSAVSVNAASGAEALTRSRHAQNRKHVPARTTPRQRPITPVDTAVDCGRVRQKPHIPSIVGAAPGSRSVELSWRYPTTTPQDCVPSTYVVSVRPASANTPDPPAPLVVQGQTSTVVTGLYPSSRYQLTVTAYLNGQGTTSAPRTVTTGRAGPPAPTDVRAVTDDAGNWQVTWHGCGAVAAGCVRTATWRVIPQFCDGHSVSTPPDPTTIAADPVATTASTTVRGGDALLGRGLRFLVEGIGTTGAIGGPSAYTACTYSWTPPVTGDISVRASTPPTAGQQGQVATTATVRFAGGAVHDLGGLGGTLTYRLLDSDGDIVATQGPTTAQSVSLGGIAPGAHYSVQVVVSPPRHPEAAVTLAPVTVAPAQQSWPAPDVTATFADNDALTGTLSVSFQLPGVSNLHGETFDLTEGSALSCGGQRKALDGTDVSAGQRLDFTIDRTQWSGRCRVDLVLVQHLSTEADPPLFDAGFSPRGGDDVTIDAPTVLTTLKDFSATWNDGYQPSIRLAYTGGDDLAHLASGWSVTVGNGSDDCGSGTGPDDDSIAVTPSCVVAGGPFVVHVHYEFAGQTEDFSVPVGGDAPNPVSATDLDFTASWNNDATAPTLVLTGSGSVPTSVLAQLNWTATVTSNDTVCGSNSDAPDGDGTISVPVDYSKCPPTGDDGTANPFSTTIEFDDPVYGGHGSYTPAIINSPPT